MPDFSLIVCLISNGKLHFLVILTLITGSLFAQTDSAMSQTDDFTTIIQKLSDQIQSVEAGKETFDQRLKKHSETPYGIVITITETDAKGRSEENEYLVNFQDIDQNLVRWKARKDIIEVSIKTTRSQDVIQHHQNGALQNYTDQITILATDVDNGRELQQLFKDLVPVITKSMENQLNIPDYASQMDWLSEHITNVEVEEETVRQSWKSQGEEALEITFQVEKEGKKESLINQFDFNLGDLKEQSVQLKVKGKKVFVEVETERKRNMVKVIENGVLENYGDKIQIYTEQIDQARNIVQVLQMIIPEAQKRLKAKMDYSENTPDLLSLIKQEITDLQIDDETYQQQLEPICATSLTSNEANSKNENKYEFHFNFADLNPRDTDIRIKGNAILIENKTVKNQKLIQVFEDGEIQNYKKDLVIRASTIENARRLVDLIPLAAQYCQKELEKWETPVILTENLNWLEEQIKNLQMPDASYEQNFKVIDQPCKCQLDLTEITSKKSTSNIWEFNLKDLDPRELKFDVDGKQIYITTSTRYGDKTIKSYKNGETDDYANKLSILCEDIETARRIIKVMSASVKICNE